MIHTSLVIKMTVLTTPSKNRSTNQMVTSLRTANNMSSTAARHRLETHMNQAPKRLANGGINGDENIMPRGVMAALRPIRPALAPILSRIRDKSG